jgi:SAM-dependent methyltransferase
VARPRRLQTKEAMASFRNAYEDAGYAAAYAKLEFHGTYYLAFRDLPAIFREHVAGTCALDFGCGAGRSTRFLRSCGFRTVGIDIAEEMLVQARGRDPEGAYVLVPDGDYGTLREGVFDLVFSAFTFDNVPTQEAKVRAMRGIRRLLAPHGRFVHVVSSPELYTHEWASFSTRRFPENRDAKAGDIVRCVNVALDDHRPVDDVFWSDAAYVETHALAGLEAVREYRPLARGDEPCDWVNETCIAPWVVYVLQPKARRARASG